MISAKVIKDSVAPSGVRLTTFVLTYPRFIHAEFMTHRVFSRNASSSRAIPVNKQIQEIIDNPAIPLEFRKNQKGMQAGELLEDQDLARSIWLQARDSAVVFAQAMVKMDIHKQYANRILEPFAHITVIVTSTQYSNFFALRYHGAAQPEICELAKQMWQEYGSSNPQQLEFGQWHLPFIDEVLSSKEVSEVKNEVQTDEKWSAEVSIGYEYDDVPVKRSVAKCARVSYKNHDGTETTEEQDLSLYDRLLGQIPIHASPAEHQAMAVDDPEEQSGNFHGWVQYRKTLANENVEEFTAPSDDKQS